MMLIDLVTIPGQIKRQEDCVSSNLLTRLVSSKAQEILSLITVAGWE